MKRFFVKLLLVAGGSFVGVSAIEAMLLLLLSYPALARRMPPSLFDAVRWIYLRFDSKMVQFDPACARYDDELFYTLKPGHCTFAAREFDTRLDINSLGVRDDEEALRAPEVIVAGDSYAMGWGVSKEARYAQALEEKTGYRVLDMGVASYGTVRELRFLNRIDFSHVKYLIIEYDDNDFHENAVFAEDRDVLRIHDRAFYQGIIHGEALLHHYYWGRYTIELLREWFSAHADGGIGPLSSADRSLAPAVFVNALMHATRQPLDGVKIIVFESHFHADFLSALDKLRQEPGQPRFIREMQVLDLALPADDYFILDNHLNPKGHAAVAEKLAGVVGHHP